MYIHLQGAIFSSVGLWFYSERLVKSTADVMVARGFSAAGYKYLIVDDCWMDAKRTSEGKLQGDLQRFPSGIPSLVQYVSSDHQQQLA